MKQTTFNYVRKMIAAQLAHLSGELAKDHSDTGRILREMVAAQDALADIIAPPVAEEVLPAAQLIHDTVGMNKRSLSDLASAGKTHQDDTVKKGARVLDSVLQMSTAKVAEELEAILQHPPKVQRAGELANGLREGMDPREHRRREREAAAS